MKMDVRSLVRLISLFLIFSLWFTGKIEFWMIFLVIGLVLMPFWGRIYCGWICPIFTTLDICAPLHNKPLLVKYSKYLERKTVKIVGFVIFLVAFLLIKKLNLSVPFFILLIPVGLIFAVLFGAVQWHRICPFGTIFNFLARFSQKGYLFKSQDCLKCGLCVKKCANSCLQFKKDRTLIIDKQHCLACGICQTVCPENNIYFGKIKLTPNQDTFQYDDQRGPAL